MTVKQRFQPIVSLTPRDDGRFDVEVDWDSSQIPGWDIEASEEVYDDSTPEAIAAAEALDAWVDRSGPQRFIIPAGSAPTPDARDARLNHKAEEA